MLLVAPNFQAIVPFPCPVFIECVSAEDELGKPVRTWKILAGDYVQLPMAQYSSLAPAKMELMRLYNTYEQNPNTTSFEFLKEG